MKPFQWFEYPFFGNLASFIGKFHALPAGPVAAITTPLFTLKDKFRILGEPWRKKGNDPNESVGSLAQRRLGRSFFEYAVDPFVSGVYAGDPMKLTTVLCVVP